ncbi:TPA: hypothetical protein ACSVQZ_003765 [Clostridioides difficile]
MYRYTFDNLPIEEQIKYINNKLLKILWINISNNITTPKIYV